MCIVLIIEDNIWPPYVVTRNVKHIHSTIFIRVPLQFVVIPILGQKQNIIISNVMYIYTRMIAVVELHIDDFQGTQVNQKESNILKEFQKNYKKMVRRAAMNLSVNKKLFEYLC